MMAETGSMASKPGGYSGGDRGPMGSHTGPGSASGSGFGKPDGGFPKGMQGATARRTASSVPSYQGSLHNYGQLAKEVIGFMGGPVTTAAKAIAGVGPDYQGYTGHVNTPGFADPNGAQRWYQGAQANPTLMNRAALYGSGPAAMQYAAQGLPQMFMPQQAQPQAPAQPKPMGFMPGANIGTGGKYGASTFRPGYNFFTPGGI